MDPLSITASVSALIQLSSIVIGYLSDVKGGPKELQRLRLELCGVLPVLSILQDEAEQATTGGLWSSTLSSLDVPNGPNQQFGEALERLEAKLAPVGGWRKVGKAFTWPFEKDEILAILSTVERQKLLFTLARQNDHIALTKAIKGDVETVHGKINEIGEGVAKLDLGEKHHKIRLWLSGSDPSSNYNKALAKRQGGTGSWLLENDVFRDWEQGPNRGSIVWLYGIPGCGKTILCSTVLEYVLHLYAGEPHVAVLYFFFDFQDSDKQQPDGMIRSLLSQLYMHCPRKPLVLESLYSSCLDGERDPTFEALLEAFHHIAATFEKTFIVVDALDECKARPEMLADIEELIGWKDANLRILVTSRREKDIEDSLLRLTKDTNRICIQSTIINADIHAYVHDQIQRNKRLKRWQKEPKVQMEIEETLMKKANGMFRWATCQLDVLGNCLTLPKLRKALETLPRTLNDTYARILCNIDEEYQQYALHILQWLAFSVRPLHLEELSEVIALDVNDTPQFDPQRRLPDPGDVVEICSSLITVTYRSSDDAQSGRSHSNSYESYVSLAHFSVKEYLTSDFIRQGQAIKYSLEEIDCHLALTRDCLAYLSHLERASLNSAFLASYPLAQYVATHWTEHARVAEKRDKTVCQDFFLRKGKDFMGWLLLRGLEHLLSHDLTKSPRKMASPLYYASEAGLVESVKILLSSGANVNAQSGLYKTALIAASSEGHVEVVRLLLEKSAHLDLKSFLFGTALQAATHSGHLKIVQVLLEKGADVNARHKHRPGSALLTAIERKDTNLAQLLLEKGADVTARDRADRSPLEVASCRGLQSIVELILDKDVMADEKGEKYSRALAEASKRHQDGLVQRLLDKGAIINAPVIRAALEGGSTKILRILLNHITDLGDLSMPDPEGRALCHHASAQNSVATLEILIKLGSDLMVTDKQGRTCLHHAVIRDGRRMGVFKDLRGKVRPRSHGSNVDCNPPSTVTWLLKQGFDPNLPDRDGWTPLHWAAKVGEAATIEILEDAGATFSPENIMAWTPNDVAMFHNHRISWKRNFPHHDVGRPKPTQDRGTSPASLIADVSDELAEIRPGVVHRFFCDGCDFKILGPRYRCTTCPDFDYCFKCKQSSDDAHPGHPFIEIKRPVNVS